MTRFVSFRCLVVGVMFFVGLGEHRSALGQAGLRDALEKLDRNADGEIAPDEITALSRPYLERITRERRISLNRPLRIEQLQEAARVYFAIRNGSSGRNVRPQGKSSIQAFGPQRDEPLVPQFGLPYVKYPYTQDDLDFADRTMRSHDRNNDGFIDRNEASRNRWTHRNPFDDDLNKDERLSRLELAHRYARRRLLERASGQVWQKARRVGHGIQRFERKSNSSRNSSQWWRSGGSGYWLTASVLGRFDANRNGRLESTEAEKTGLPVAKLDVNRDGELSREELHNHLAELQKEAGDNAEGVPEWFFELDRNRDGQVAMSEFTTEWTKEKLNDFTSLDTNRDGLLTTSEVLKAGSVVGGNFANSKGEVLPPRKTIVSEINVSEDFVISDLDVQLSITHTSVGHLDVYLTSPDGQRIELFTEIGGSGDNFDQTYFDDQSRYPISKARSPYKGRFQPESTSKGQPSLASYNGKNIKGVWQLVVRASRSERFGMLHGWSLIARPEGSVAPANIMRDGPVYERRDSSSSRSSPSRSSSSRSSSPPSSSNSRSRSSSQPSRSRSDSSSRSSGGSGDSRNRDAERDALRRRLEERERTLEKYKQWIESQKQKRAGKENKERKPGKGDKVKPPKVKRSNADDRRRKDPRARRPR